MNADIHNAARTVWDYHRLGHLLEPVDLILVLGSHDLRVAGHAADLFHRRLAPRVVLSGGSGRLTAGVWSKPEAEMFADVLRERGVPESAMLLENRSTNTGENVRFTRSLLAARGIEVASVIAVQKPYMERRAFATIRRQWPEIAVCISSPPLDFEAYCSGDISPVEIINAMVGDLQRVLDYPRLGYMIAQDVPESVRQAYDFLIAAGFDQHLLKSK